MNVAVVGSFREDQNKRLLGQKQQFEIACKILGRKLAEWGHRLVVPHPEHSDTAETHALQGFTDVAPYHYLSIIEHEGDPVLRAGGPSFAESAPLLFALGGKGGYTMQRP